MKCQSCPVTPWLRATVLAIVVASSTAAVPPGGWPHGGQQAYSAGLAGVPSGADVLGTPAGSAPIRGPLGEATSASPALSGPRSPGRVPADVPRRGTDRPYATVTPPPSAFLAGSTSASRTPAHGPRPTATRPSAFRPGGPSDSSPDHGPPHAAPSASVAPSPSAATPSRAGSRAGEGRERPGRREVPVAEDAETPEADSTGIDSGDGDLTAVSEPPRKAAPPSRPAERPVAGTKVFILPLGTGLVLVGLGLGLGLFALRVRRG